MLVCSLTAVAVALPRRAAPVEDLTAVASGSALWFTAASTVTDIARLLTAAHLGLCATTTLLLAAIALATPHPRRLPAAAALLLVAVTGIVVTVLRAESRAASALDGLPLLLVALLALAAPGVRAGLRAAPGTALAAVGVLRLAGLDALWGARGGWLPVGPARQIAGVELASALCALAAAALLRRSPRASRAALALSVVGAAATAAVMHTAVRPLPGFAAVYAGPFLALCAAAALGALASARSGIRSRPSVVRERATARAQGAQGNR